MDIVNNSFGCDDCSFKILLCGNIPVDDFRIIRNTARQLRYKKNETIIKQGTKATHVAFLYKGIVKMAYEDRRGRNLIVSVLSEQKFLGCVNMFFKDTNVFSLVAVEECDICLLDYKVISRLVEKNSVFASNIFRHSIGMFEAAIENYVSLAHRQANGRIADVLLYLSKNVYKKKVFEMSLSRVEIAEYAACSRENVITILKKFNKEGIIDFKEKTIEIKNVDKLMEISRNG
ncbi:MAG: Crp/Fnr family transcriptional regulator [Bacteroidales bacterium]|nr:Crp/Fnr family transcriptional regulator [Bacteroidales bacterium]